MAATTELPTPNRSTSRPAAPQVGQSHSKDDIHASVALPDLRLIARQLDDIEQLRIQTQLRIGAAERERGFALPHLHGPLELLQAAEDQAERELLAAFRHHPLSAWAKTVLGLGRRIEGQRNLARLIAEVGDPAERTNPAKLFAFCGHGDPARRHRKGMTQAEMFKCGNPHAKKRVRLIAEAMLKAGNRDAYDREKERCHRLHPDWTDGHKHSSALRVQGREFLKLLWNASLEHR